MIGPLAPALAFLLVGVPLAVLLDEVGLFDAVAGRIVRPGEVTPVLGLWLLAAATTVLLNLDTTIVLLTPLYLRVARRADVDPVPVVAVPLLLAALASSVLPISNLTTLIAVDRFGIGPATVLAHLALPSAAAVTVGWLAYRRRHPTHLPPTPPNFVGERMGGTRSPTKLGWWWGGGAVAVLLAGVLVGPSVGVAPWMVVAGIDLVLMAVTRTVPWRSIPVGTAIAVLAVAAVVAVVVPDGALSGVLARSAPLGLVAVAATATALANAVNNLPAALVGFDAVDRQSWGLWAWLLGVNAGAVLVPVGALANLLWWRVLRAEGIAVGLARYLRLVVPVAVPAVVAAVSVLALERAVAG